MFLKKIFPEFTGNAMGQMNMLPSIFQHIRFSSEVIFKACKNVSSRLIALQRAVNEFSKLYKTKLKLKFTI